MSFLKNCINFDYWFIVLILSVHFFCLFSLWNSSECWLFSQAFWCCVLLDHGSFLVCSDRKRSSRTSQVFISGFPCYNFSLFCKSEKEMWLLNFDRFSLSPTVLWRQMAYQRQAWVSEGYARNWKRDPKISCGWLRTVVICKYLWSWWIIAPCLSQQESTRMTVLCITSAGMQLGSLLAMFRVILKSSFCII